MEAFLPILHGLVTKYPIITSILLFMGILRVVMKPLFAVLHAYVIATPSEEDNKLLGKVEDSVPLKGLFFVLDYLASIKLIK